MSDTRVRGAHREFDANEVVGRFAGEDPGRRVIFICPKAEQLLIQLKRQKKTVINGEVIEEEQVVARFQDHTFISEDDELTKLVRKHKVYKTGRVIELGQLAQKAKAKRVADLVAQLQDPSVAAEVKAALELGSAHVPTVKAKAKSQQPEA